MSNVAKSKRAGIGLLRKLIILAILAGIGYGAWIFIKQNKSTIKERVNNAVDSGTNILDGGTQRKQTLEDAAN